MNALHFAFGLGAFLAPVVIAQLGVRSDDLRWAYWTLAALMLPPAVWLWRLPSPERKNGDGDGSRGRSSISLLVLFVAFFMLYVSAEVSFGGWAFTYSVQMGLADEAAAAYLTSAFWGALTVGRLLAIPIAARVRPVWMLLGDLVGAIVSVAAILAWPASQLALWIGALGLGLSLASIFPTLMSLAERRMAVTGRVTGWFLVGSSVGGMTLPWVIGQLFEPAGPRVAIVAIGVVLVAALGTWAAVSFGYGSGEQSSSNQPATAG
jgi:FHS family Na+ dependent glucose MFS transporter 1